MSAKSTAGVQEFAVPGRCSGRSTYQMSSRTTPSTLFLAFLIGGLGVLALHTTVGFGGSGLNAVFEYGVYTALMFGATFTVLVRAARVSDQRPAWMVMGAGMLSWSIGELYDTLFIEHTSAATGGTVSIADVFFLASYPCFYVSLTRLARAHLRELRIGMWFDGLIAGLGAATVAAALILPPILHSATGNPESVVVSLAYPIGDLLMMMFALGAIGITGWRPGSVWLLIACGMLVSAVADSTYLYQTATDSYRPGTWLESMWPLAAILLAIAAWTPARSLQRRRMEGWQMVLVPTLALVVALGVLVYGNIGAQLTLPALILAAATVLAVGVHLTFTLRQNLALLADSRRLSLTDPLTGLANRRLLMSDLRRVCKTADPLEPCELVLYDLDGFKLYNDAFGHPAGDTLLIRLSERLRCTVEPHGTAYRMGGDEFCVLFECSSLDNQTLVRASVAALSEHGPGFSITASHGVVRVPEEVCDPASVMQLADQRLYRRKEEVAARRAGAHVSLQAPSPLGATDRLLAAGVPTLSERGSRRWRRSADTHDSENALSLGEHNGGPLAGASPEQSPGDRRIGR
jgi:two-component system, cell cycle response regulator